MRKLLILAAIFCTLLFALLNCAFNAIHTASTQAAQAAQAQVDSVAQ